MLTHTSRQLRSWLTCNVRQKMTLLLAIFAGASLFFIGVVRLLRGAKDDSAVLDSDAGKTSAYWGLACLIVAGLAWYPLSISGLYWLVAPIPCLLGAHALAVARKATAIVIGAICYAVPFVVAYALFRHVGV